MSIKNTLELVAFGPVIPVIVLERVEDAVPLARALVAGGVRVLEVTLRTVDDVHAAKKAGCQFGVSPAYTSEIAQTCRAIGLPLLPGVATASEVMQANADGFSFLKFFPATAAGGVPMLAALAGPFPDVAFCPTGGITAETAPQFLSLANVKVCGGSWLTPADALKAGDWARITALAQATYTLR